MDNVFFDSGTSLLRIFIVGVLAYLALILMIRISGKRTLAQMSAFDFLITVALGSTLSSVITAKDVALADGILALGLLILLQFAVAKLTIRSDKVRKLVEAKPRLLFLHGEYMTQAMEEERVTEAELHAAIRRQGLESPDQVDAIVMESTGEFTVLYQRHAANTAIEVLKYVRK